MSDTRAVGQGEAPSRDPLQSSFMYRCGKLVLRPIVTLGFDLKVHGAHHVPRTGGVLLVSNHQSYLDPVLVGELLRRPLCFLAKSELFENRYFGRLIRSLNAFPVRQGAGDVGAVKEMLKRLSEGWMLTMFPEGSRSEDGEIAPIEKGAALVLRRAGVPCVPVVVEGAFDAWPKGRKLPRPWPVDVSFAPPMQLAGLQGEQITRLIDGTLRGMLQDLRRQRAARQRERWTS